MRRDWLEFPGSASVREVLAHFGMVSADGSLPPEIAVGVFSQLVTLDHVLSEGDRVEVYRPLAISPAERRRQRAAQRKQI
jgi:putative ubiquitin-RnfH superfamily antitoxin RatB of RatAB toxin-antitoxin module